MIEIRMKNGMSAAEGVGAPAGSGQMTRPRAIAATAPSPACRHS
jgi:hypothetical protein